MVILVVGAVVVTVGVVGVEIFGSVIGGVSVACGVSLVLRFGGGTLLLTGDDQSVGRFVKGKILDLKTIK